eukprot:gb/GECG01014166.1/.p1 GENE.gb/GECG01014166.1/~~gb/GECG01014166.1/.p1  ORF type:complete len:727 (+),score=72.52 gb/GECG01014166.1/:1-2181(+)
MMAKLLRRSHIARSGIGKLAFPLQTDVCHGYRKLQYPHSRATEGLRRFQTSLWATNLNEQERRIVKSVKQTLNHELREFDHSDSSLDSSSLEEFWKHFLCRYYEKHNHAISSHLGPLEVTVVAARHLSTLSKERSGDQVWPMGFLSPLVEAAISHCEKHLEVVPPELLAIFAHMNIRNTSWTLKDWSNFYTRAVGLCSEFVEALDAHWRAQNHVAETLDINQDTDLSMLDGSDAFEDSLYVNGWWDEICIRGVPLWLYTSVLGALCRKSDSITFWWVWDEMIGNGIVPKEKQYALAMRVCVQIADYSTLFNLYDDLILRRQSLQISCDVFEPLLEACSKTKNVEGAKQVWFDMMRLGVEPSTNTWEIYLKCAVNGFDSEFTARILKDMRRMNYKFTHEIYLQLLRLCQRKSDFDEAVRIFKELRNAGMEPSSRFLEMLLRIAHEAEAYEVVKKLKSLIQKRGTHDLWYLESVLAWQTQEHSRARFHTGHSDSRAGAMQAIGDGPHQITEKNDSWRGNSTSTAARPQLHTSVPTGVFSGSTGINDPSWSSVWCSAKVRYLYFEPERCSPYIQALYQGLSKALSNVSLMTAVSPVVPFVWRQYLWDPSVSGSDPGSCPTFDANAPMYGYSSVFTFYNEVGMCSDRLHIKRISRTLSEFEMLKRRWNQRSFPTPVSAVHLSSQHANEAGMSERLYVTDEFSYGVSGDDSLTSQHVLNPVDTVVAESMIS